MNSEATSLAAVCLTPAHSKLLSRSRYSAEVAEGDAEGCASAVAAVYGVPTCGARFAAGTDLFRHARKKQHQFPLLLLGEVGTGPEPEAEPTHASGAGRR